MSLAESLTVFFQEATNMPTNRVQLQPGMLIHDFMDYYVSEAQCAQALFLLRWPCRFRLPRCGGVDHCRAKQVTSVLLQCSACRNQASLKAGTVMDSAKLTLRKWFKAMYLISQSNAGLSALALLRQPGVTL